MSEDKNPLAGIDETTFDKMREAFDIQDNKLNEECEVAAEAVERSGDDFVEEFPNAIGSDETYEIDVIKYVLDLNNKTFDDVKFVNCKGKFFQWDTFKMLLENLVAQDEIGYNVKPLLPNDTVIYGNGFIINRCSEITTSWEYGGHYTASYYKVTGVELSWEFIPIPDVVEPAEENLLSLLEFVKGE